MIILKKMIWDPKSRQFSFHVTGQGSEAGSERKGSLRTQIWPVRSSNLLAEGSNAGMVISPKLG